MPPLRQLTGQDGNFSYTPSIDRARLKYGNRSWNLDITGERSRLSAFRSSSRARQSKGCAIDVGNERASGNTRCQEACSLPAQ